MPCIHLEQFMQPQFSLKCSQLLTFLSKIKGVFCCELQIWIIFESKASSTFHFVNSMYNIEIIGCVLMRRNDEAIDVED